VPLVPLLLMLPLVLPEALPLKPLWPLAPAEVDVSDVVPWRLLNPGGS
jgi:hypothetical protein